MILISPEKPPAKEDLEEVLSSYQTNFVPLKTLAEKTSETTDAIFLFANLPRYNHAQALTQTSRIKQNLKPYQKPRIVLVGYYFCEKEGWSREKNAGIDRIYIHPESFFGSYFLESALHEELEIIRKRTDIRKELNQPLENEKINFEDLTPEQLKTIDIDRVFF